MSATDTRPTLPYEAARLIEREAMLLDEARWDEWLSLFTEDCAFWIPAWRRDGTLTDNPALEVSHIYAQGHRDLAERIGRIRSGRAAASTPLQRTTHILGTPMVALGPQVPDCARLSTPFATHAYSPRTRETTLFFGQYEHVLRPVDSQYKIVSKKVVVRNDYVPTMIDFYCV